MDLKSSASHDPPHHLGWLHRSVDPSQILTRGIVATDRRHVKRTPPLCEQCFELTVGWTVQQHQGWDFRLSV